MKYTVNNNHAFSIPLVTGQTHGSQFPVDSEGDRVLNRHQFNLIDIDMRWRNATKR